MPERPFFDGEHPIALAHRGSRLLWPENTMPAFQGAVDLGYHYLETDLHASKDGVLVCIHDDTLQRTTDGHGKVWHRDLADLERLDAGFRFDPIRHFPYRDRGVTIPTLEEVVTTFPEVRLTLDLKQGGLEEALAGLVERLDLHDRLIIGSFRDRRIARFRKATSDRVATSAGPRETFQVWSAARAGRSIRFRADALQVPERWGSLTVVDRRLVDAVHAQDKQVHVWTVNDAEDMRRLLDLGVDGLITDRPDLLNGVLGRGNADASGSP